MSEILSADTQSRMAIAAGVLATQALFMTRCETEIEAIFARHPALPRTEAVRRVLWGLAFNEISEAVSSAPAASIQPADSQSAQRQKVA